MFAVGQRWERAGTVTVCQFEGEERKRADVRQLEKRRKHRAAGQLQGVVAGVSIDGRTAELHALCGARFAGEFQAN